MTYFTIIGADFMRILHAGSMVNFGYIVTTQLRAKNIDVDLVIAKDPSKTDDPLVFDSKLNTYPEWIKFFDKKKSSWKWDLIKTMRHNYDLIHADVEYPIFAYFSRKKFIAQTQGSDLRELAFSNSTKGFLLRRAYRKAKVILYFQPDHEPLFSKLNLTNQIFLPPSGYTTFYEEPSTYSDSEYSDKFLIFHPANLEWRLKGNDKLLKGFAKFVKSNPDSFMIIVDRGPDSTRTHELVKQLGIEKFVKFIKGPLNPSDLKKYYNLADVVADHFAYGSLGSIGWEVLASKKPLLGFIFDDLYTKLYGESPPVVNSLQPSEISDSLELLKDSKTRFTLGKQGKDWITKYHSPKIYLQKLTTIYELVIDGKNIDDIRYELEKIHY